MLFRRRHAGARDSELVALVAKGNESAFKELLDRYQAAVYNLAYRFLNDANEAEDIAQETFLRLYRTANRYKPQASLRTYLFRIAKNLCIDFLRKKRPEPMEHLPEKMVQDSPLDQLERAQALEIIFNCIDKLPENQRMAILLRHTSGLRYQEIADVMGLTVSAVESLLVRARKTLRQRLASSQ